MGDVTGSGAQHVHAPATTQTARCSKNKRCRQPHILLTAGMCAHGIECMRHTQHTTHPRWHCIAPVAAAPVCLAASGYRPSRPALHLRDAPAGPPHHLPHLLSSTPCWRWQQLLLPPGLLWLLQLPRLRPPAPAAAAAAGATLLRACAAFPSLLLGLPAAVEQWRHFSTCRTAVCLQYIQPTNINVGMCKAGLPKGC